MDIESVKIFDFFIICNTKDKQEKLLKTLQVMKKLKWFEGYEIREEKEEWIDMAFTKLDDMQTQLKEYTSFHNFLINRGFLKDSSGQYVKSLKWYEPGWNAQAITTTVMVLVLTLMMMFHH